MGKSCRELAQSLYDCMKDGECMKQGNNVKECIKIDVGSCKELHGAYTLCRMKGLDNRSRIRGVRIH